MTFKKTLLLSHDGISQTATDWIKDSRYTVDVVPTTIWKRKRKGWSDYDAIFKPADKTKRPGISSEVWHKRIKALPMCRPGSAASTREIVGALKEQYPGIGLGTCGECMLVMHKEGKVDRIEDGSGQEVRWKFRSASPLSYAWRTKSNEDLRVVSRQFGSPV